MNLSSRVEKLEEAMKPCLFDRDCLDLETRYGMEAARRAFAFLDKLVLEEAERRGDKVIELQGETVVAEEKKAWLETLDWSELDDEIAEAHNELCHYGFSVQRRPAPDWFCPAHPRDTEQNRLAVDRVYLIEADPHCRSLWKRVIGLAGKLAATHSGNGR